ncbi:MAG: modified peptide precursor CbpA [Thauera sp.]|nr:modified peptide precursor CbpA [Thauera sp.]
MRDRRVGRRAGSRHRNRRPRQHANRRGNDAERAGNLTAGARPPQNRGTFRFDETEHGANPWRTRRCIRGWALHIRKSCNPDGIGLSHYVLIDRKVATCRPTR